MTDPFRGYITFAAEQLPGYTGQWHVRCTCGWRDQAVHKRIARETAAAHVGAEHGVTVPAPATRPGRARPLRPVRQSIWAGIKARR